jgi:hypothetical protein
VSADLHPSPLEKFEWVSDLCPIFFFPPVEGIRVGHFRARAPFIMLFPVSFVMDKVLYSSPTPAGVHNFVDVPLLSAVFSNDGPRSGQLVIREEEGVVRDVPLQ